MEQKRSHFLTRRKYILYNLCLVMVPVFLLTMLFSLIMVRHVTNEMVQRYSTELAQKSRIVDERLESFAQMVAYASVDSDLSPYNLKQNSYDTVVALQHMRQLSSALGDTVTYFYVDADDYLYSPTGKWSLSTFEREYTFEGDWTQSDFEALLHSKRAYTTSPIDCELVTVNGRRRYIVVVYPWRHGLVQYGAGICLIPRDWFEDVLFTSDRAPLYIVDEDGGVWGRQGSAESSFIDSAMKGSPEELKLGGQTWRPVRARSRLTGWNYITAVSKNEIVSLVYGERPWIFPALTTSMLVCVALGVILGLRYYRPVDRLGRLLGHGGEVQDVHEKVSDILLLNREMEHSLEEKQDSIERDTAAKLLWTGLDEDACAELCRQNGITLGQSPFSALAIDVFGQSNAAAEKMLELFKNRGILATISPHSGYIAAIVSAMGEKDVQKYAEELKDSAFYDLKLSLRIGIGAEVDRFSDLGRSYVEAIAALREATWGEVSLFDEIIGTQSRLLDKSVASSTARLSEALSLANEKAVHEACEELLEGLNAIYRETDQVEFRFTMNSVLKDLLPSLERNAPEDLSWKLNLALHALKPAPFIEQLRSLCCRCAQSNQFHRNSRLNRQMAQILEYIDEHFTDQGLSQSQIADKFDMSTTGVSRLFNESLGILFVDYVSQKRMSYGAELLANTRLSIKEIVSQIGYIDVSSFSRKFSQLYGMSPGAYRKQYMQEN